MCSSLFWSGFDVTPFALDGTPEKQKAHRMEWAACESSLGKKLAARLRPHGGRTAATGRESMDACGVGLERVQNGEHQRNRLRRAGGGVNRDLSGPEIVMNISSLDGNAIGSVPVPLPPPAFFGPCGICLNESCRDFSAQRLLTVWTTG